MLLLTLPCPEVVLESVEALPEGEIEGKVRSLLSLGLDYLKKMGLWLGTIMEGMLRYFCSIIFFLLFSFVSVCVVLIGHTPNDDNN